MSYPQYQPPPCRPAPRGWTPLRIYLLTAGIVLAVVIVIFARVIASAQGAASGAPGVIASFSGEGSASTARFTVSGNWKLAWEYDCSGFTGQSGNFIVSTDDGDQLINELGAGGNGSSWAYGDDGTRALKIISECSWSAKVIGAP